MIDEAEIRRHYELLRPDLDERGRRLFAATQVRALGYGGLAAVARATGIARSTIGRGLKELEAGSALDQRVRRPGGGRKRLSDTDATLARDLLRLVEPATLGDPIRPLLWVSKNVAKLAATLRELGHRVSANTVRRLLRTLGFTADCGGSNGARVRLWKRELQTLADETGLSIQVSHYPPGTSKWNKIEHRLFCQISQTWRARPLTSRLAVVELIAATTTRTGLMVACELDTTDYPKGLKVSDAEMDAIAITGDDFHPE